MTTDLNSAVIFALIRNIMMTASVLAGETGVSLFTISPYTRIGLLNPTRNTQNNYKLYVNQ